MLRSRLQWRSFTHSVNKTNCSLSFFLFSFLRSLLGLGHQACGVRHRAARRSVAGLEFVSVGLGGGVLS